MIRVFSVGTMARKVTHVLGSTLRQVDFIAPAYARQGPAPKMRQNQVLRADRHQPRALLSERQAETVDALRTLSGVHDDAAAGLELRHHAAGGNRPHLAPVDGESGRHRKFAEGYTMFVCHKSAKPGHGYPATVTAPTSHFVWVTVNVLPAMFAVPTRSDGAPVSLSTSSRATPGPTPDAPATIDSHAAWVWAVHVHADPVTTFTVMVAPPFGTVAVEGEILYRTRRRRRFE